MFDRARKMRTMEAAIIHYEDELIRKNRMLEQCGRTMEAAENMGRVLEECNESLAAENARLAAIRDQDEDLMAEMWAEYQAAMQAQDEVEALKRENYRLWVENRILMGELACLSAEKAAEIGRY